jgi:hypothetical protein
MIIERKLIDGQSARLWHSVVAATLLLGLSLPLRAAEIISGHSLGTGLVAFVRFQPSADIRVEFFIFANFNATKPSGDNAQVSSTVEAAYFVFDDSIGAALIVAQGSAQFPGGSAVQIQPTLKAGRVKASFVIKDLQTGESIPVVINAALTGGGDFVKGMDITHVVGPDNDQNKGPDFVINVHGTGDFRGGATPSGIVTFGTTTYDLSQATAFDAFMFSSNIGSVSISRQ